MHAPFVPDVATGSTAWPGDPVEVLRALYPRLLAAARGIGAEEDLVQEALVETLSRHRGFEGIEHPLGYTKVVLFRLAYRRRGPHRREVPLDLQESLEGAPDPADRVGDRLVVSDALMALGARQRACVVLRFVEGLDDDAISSALGCSRSTVRSQIARARKRLRSELDEQGGDQ